MAAILERDGRVFLLREQPDSVWSLPGGPLPLEKDDIDAEMDALLQGLGVLAPAIEEDFLATHYFPVEDGQVVYNVYAATGWAGEPVAAAGVGAGWFGLAELASIALDRRAEQAVLEAFGIREPVDRTGEILRAVAAEIGARDTGSPPAPAGTSVAESSRRAAGLDVLRTLRGVSDPAQAALAMERDQPELAGDVLDFALGDVWSNPALDRRTRSLMVVAMLAATGRTGGTLKFHLHGALNHGATPEQVTETMRMVAAYAGFPAAIEAWPVMEHVFAKRGIERPGRGI